MAESVDSVYMVEAGKELQSTQRNLLCGLNSDTTQLSAGIQSISKYGKTPIVWTDSINSVPIGKCSRHILACINSLTADRARQDAFHPGP